MNPIILDPTQDPDQDAIALTPSHPHRHVEAPPCFHREIDSDGICWLTFDTPNSPANVWNIASLDQLDAQIEELHRDSAVRALVIRSAKERVFIAGADLKSLLAMPEDELHELLQLGQDVFTHLESLRLTKIAAIHGACVGGGFEMALACDRRIASLHESTRIGLPETQLGLIPSWGGSTRLPRLIGLPKALDLIVRGKTLKPIPAKKMGLVDEVTAPEHLEALARKLALQSTPVKHHHFHFSDVWPFPQLLRLKAKAMLHGKYPWMKVQTNAQTVAIDVVTKGATSHRENAFKLEQTAMKELMSSPSTKRLIQVFFANEAATKKLPASLVDVPTRLIQKTAVIGGGVMGTGIAYIMASRGRDVLVSDTAPQMLANSAHRIHKLLRDGLKHHALDKRQAREVEDRIVFTHEKVPLMQQDLIIEAIVEEMTAKKALLADLATRTSDQTILATNTSALSVTEMARATPHPERVIGLHFFNPAHRMPLVEVITHELIDPAVLASTLRFVQSLGKTPIVVKDRPGFVVNRILMPYLMAAVTLAETMRDPWDLDDAMEVYGMPMGPLRLLDEIGFDVAIHVEKTLRASFGQRLPDGRLLHRMVDEGMLGRKNQRGFYTAHSAQSGPQPNPEILPLLSPRHLPPFRSHEDMAEHLAHYMREEAQRCLNEGVAANASDIELSMILGAGFPPFRKLMT